MRMKMVVSGALALLALCAGLGTAANAAPAPHLVVPNDVAISQVSTRGPVGLTDQYIEIHNQSQLSVDISGWSIDVCSATNQVTDLVDFPAGTVLAPENQQGEYYLVANALGYSRATTPDLTYTGTVPLNGGVKLVDMANVTHDSVGFVANNACTSGSPATAQRVSDDQANLRVAETGYNAVDFRLYGEPTFQRNQFSE
jgi:hypothetical protein